MQIYQPFITNICAAVANTTADTHRDFEIASLIAAPAQTIVFSADQALALRPALERFEETIDYRLIWVRPHQRGLAHELYIPSVRVVE